MKKMSIVVAIVTAAALAFTGCGKKKEPAKAGDNMGSSMGSDMGSAGSGSDMGSGAMGSGGM